MRILCDVYMEAHKDKGPPPSEPEKRAWDQVVRTPTQQLGKDEQPTGRLRGCGQSSGREAKRQCRRSQGSKCFREKSMPNHAECARRSRLGLNSVPYIGEF